MNIDFKYFNEVTSGDKNIMIEFIQIFEEQIPEFVNAFKNALQANDYNKIASIAHKAKSTVAVFGMKKWEDEFKNIQIKIQNKIIPDNLNLLILHFEKDAIETLKFFKNYVEKID
jgi:HPt (histidine-containing phosphotransfer) domain-containing protein